MLKIDSKLFLAGQKEFLKVIFLKNCWRCSNLSTIYAIERHLLVKHVQYVSPSIKISAAGKINNFNSFDTLLHNSRY